MRSNPLDFKRFFRRVCVLIGGIYLAFSLLVIGAPMIEAADPQQVPVMSLAYKDGTITAIYQSTLQIDGGTYSLTPDAVILDDSGNQLDAGMLAVTLEVKYHLKKEQNDKIDRMIVFLPR